MRCETTMKYLARGEMRNWFSGGVVMCARPLSFLEKPLGCYGFSRAGLEIDFELPRFSFRLDRYIGSQFNRTVLAGGCDIAVLMNAKTTFEVRRGPDINVAVIEFKKVDVPQGNGLPALFELREAPYALCFIRVARHPKRKARRVVEPMRFELTTSAVRLRRSPN